MNNNSKPIGIVRRIDSLNRIVIPKEICRTQKINAGDPFEILLYDGMICIKKYIDENNIMSSISDIIKTISIEEENIEIKNKVTQKLNEALAILTDR